MVGLGLMGSSFALALKKARPDIVVVGSDRNPLVVRKALDRDVVSTANTDLSVVEMADVVVVGAPISAMRELFAKLGALSEGKPVTDMASTKADVVEWAAAEGCRADAAASVAERRGNSPISSTSRSRSCSTTRKRAQLANYSIRAAPNMRREGVILSEYVKSPVDVEQHNEHMWHGTIHGGDRSWPNDGPRRPVPGWAQHRMPIPGLYQTGATTHPGGSITGAPGRNCAVVLLEDLGHDVQEVLTSGAAARA